MSVAGFLRTGYTSVLILKDGLLLRIPCNHIFHGNCIKPWLERSGTCPVCRYQLVEQPEPSRNPAIPVNEPTSPGGTAPVSPSLPRSPPIRGSSMPGGFPGIFPFFSFGTEGGADSTSSTNRSGTNNQNNQSSSNRPREEPQGQPDFDMDLD